MADITCVPTGEGWLYLATVMDLAGRRIVGWSMSENIDAHSRVHRLEIGMVAALACQGAAGPHRPQVPVRRRANAWDNAPIESFFKTLKVERIHQVRYDTRAQARLDIVDGIEDWYNRQRLHSANGLLPPVTWESTRLAA